MRRSPHALLSLAQSSAPELAFRACPIASAVQTRWAPAPSVRLAGLILFVLTLKQGQYGYQFRQLAWSHLIVFFTLLPSSFFVPLIFEGLIWFFLPLLLIIVNDIMAYLAGAPGRTPTGRPLHGHAWRGWWHKDPASLSVCGRQAYINARKAGIEGVCPTSRCSVLPDERT